MLLGLFKGAKHSGDYQLCFNSASPPEPPLALFPGLLRDLDALPVPDTTSTSYPFYAPSYPTLLASNDDIAEGEFILETTNGTESDACEFLADKIRTRVWSVLHGGVRGAITRSCDSIAPGS